MMGRQAGWLAAPVTTTGLHRLPREAQNAATRLAVLGQAKLAHYEAGALRLDDLAGDHTLPDGRAARRERTLQDLGLGRVRAARMPWYARRQWMPPPYVPMSPLRWPRSRSQARHTTPCRTSSGKDVAL